MIIVGIDPGTTGAVAWYHDGEIYRLEDLPMIEVKVGKSMRKQLQPSILANMFFEGSEEIGHVYLEHVQSMPGEGAVGAFSFGRGFGMIEGVIACMQTPYTLVRPAKWKAALGVPADKGGARALACRRFPAMAPMFARVKDDGRAEAALIALYGAGQ
jgi:crossover junction endodeoxyribonuclease RuvC